MGLPAPNGGASGAPPPGDKANAVITGVFSAIGVSDAFAFWGPFNVAVWAAINTALTTTQGSPDFSVGSGSNIAPGQGIVSVNVPPGTVVGTISGTNGTFLFPPGTSAAQIVTGTDNAASFSGSAISYAGSVQLERSFDGGSTWLPCGVGGSGNMAIWPTGTPVSITVGESERSVLYRLNCTALSSGSINYRMSQTGAAALAMAISSPI